MTSLAGSYGRCRKCGCYKDDCQFYYTLDGKEAVKICQECIKKGLGL